MAYRYQIPATGWRAIFRTDNSSYMVYPLICFEILCTDEEDEGEYEEYKPESIANCNKGSALEAQGLVFFDGHWSGSACRGLVGVRDPQMGEFCGYLAPGETLEERLSDLR